MGLSGNLKEFNITNLIQLNCIEQNTAQIVINWKGHEASIFIFEGEIIHAKFKEFKGEEAFYKIIRLDEGDFSITKPTIVPDRTIYDSWKSLLLEGARVHDESERDKDTLVRSLALDLEKHPTISRLLIVTRSGECIQNSGFDRPDRYVPLALELHRKSGQFTGRLAIGDVVYTGYSTDSERMFFFNCDSYFIVIEIGREADVAPLFELVSELKEKLQVAELQPR